MKNAGVGFYLLHIADSCEKVLRYLRDVERAEFVRNQLGQDAVLRNFEIIGEAAKHVPDDFRIRHSEINWRGMAGLRDILIHEYFGIDLVNVWNISKNAMPETLKALRNLPEYTEARNSLAESEKLSGPHGV